MVNNFVPNGYITSGGSLATSTAAAELLTQAGAGEMTRYYRKITLYNADALSLTFVDKGGNTKLLYIPATVGFSILPEDLPISSLKINESSKSYTLVAEW